MIKITDIISKMEVLRDTLKKLNEAKLKNTTVTVIKNNLMKNFVQVLMDNQFVNVIENSTVLVLKPSEETVKFSALNNIAEFTGKRKPTTCAKVNDLKTVARKTLPTISGSILLTTRQGIMTHHEALCRRTGGTIIGYIY